MPPAREHPPEDLLPAVRDYMARHGMVSPGQGVVVGVSGGPDSVALLDLLYRLREDLDLNLHVAHLNHRLRGADSDGDAAFVAGLAQKLGLPCHVEEADIRPGKFALEAAARQARLGFLERVRRRSGAGRVALGHTRSDQAETLLIRLLRGAGTQGLGAIRPVREGVWIRPLLAVSRQQVEAYLAFRNLPARHDASNADPRFLRNRIRHDLLPRLAADYTPAVEAVLARSAQILQQEDELLDGQAESALSEALRYRNKQKIILDVNTIFRYHISLRRRLLRKALLGVRAGANATRFCAVDRLLALAESPSGAVQFGPEVSARRSGPWLIFNRATSPFHIRVAVPGSTPIFPLEASVDIRIRPADQVQGRLQHLGPFRACFDQDQIKGSLVLRNRRPGDRFCPHGMAGTQKVSDLLINSKIPEPLRDEVPLLVCGNTILWVVGLRTARPAAVTSSTRTVLDVVFRGGWLCSTVS